MLKDRVEEFRKQAGLTQRGLSQASGVSHTTVWRIEAGLVIQVRPETLKKLAEPLNVTLDQLLDFAPQPTTVRSYAVNPQFDRLAGNYYRLSPADQAALVTYSDFLVTQAAEKRETSATGNPVAPQGPPDTTGGDTT